MNLGQANFGYTVVSASDRTCGGMVIAAPINCKKHYLQVRAAGGILCMSFDEAICAARILNGRLIIGKDTPPVAIIRGPDGRSRRGFKHSRNRFFKLRLNKHWLYKPTNNERDFFDCRAIQNIMEI